MCFSQIYSPLYKTTEGSLTKHHSFHFFFFEQLENCAMQKAQENETTMIWNDNIFPGNIFYFHLIRRGQNGWQLFFPKRFARIREYPFSKISTHCILCSHWLLTGSHRDGHKNSFPSRLIKLYSSFFYACVKKVFHHLNLH